MKRTLILCLCLALLLLVANLGTSTSNADTTASGNQKSLAQHNTLAFLSAAENQTKAATQTAEVAQSEIVALAEAKLHGGNAQPIQNTNSETVFAQAVVTSGQGDYDVILPQSLANSTVASQLHFGKEVAYASYLAPGVAMTAHFAQWPIGTTTPGVGAVT